MNECIIWNISFHGRGSPSIKPETTHLNINRIRYVEQPNTIPRIIKSTKKSSGTGMVLRLDGNSEHVAQGWKKIGLFGEKKNPICDFSRK